jgi:hypothetical protein
MLRAKKRVPDSLLFRCFHFRLTFESIKELGSTSTKVHLFSKSTYFVTTHVVVLGVNKSQVLIVTYVIMKQMDLNSNHKHHYNL